MLGGMRAGLHAAHTFIRHLLCQALHLVPINEIGTVLPWSSQSSLWGDWLINRPWYSWVSFSFNVGSIVCLPTRPPSQLGSHLKCWKGTGLDWWDTTQYEEPLLDRVRMLGFLMDCWFQPIDAAGVRVLNSCPISCLQILWLGRDY